MTGSHTAQAFLRETQAFFGPRAAGWEDRFPDDTPLFQRAVDEMELQRGMSVLDVGCGTGRAFPLLREAVGANGVVVGLDVTYEMVAEAQRLGRNAVARMVLGDAALLPFHNGVFHGVFAAGLVPHLADPGSGLAELACATRPGGRLAIFHPIGRAALAARHGGVPSDDDAIGPRRLGPLLASAGWALESIDDVEERYLALARRL